jgi:hypothetical protein
LNFFVFLRFELLLSPNKNDFQNFIELPLIEKGGGVRWSKRIFRVLGLTKKLSAVSFVSAGWLTKIVSG